MPLGFRIVCYSTKRSINFSLDKPEIKLSYRMTEEFDLKDLSPPSIQDLVYRYGNYDIHLYAKSFPVSLLQFTKKNIIVYEKLPSIEHMFNVLQY